MSEIISKIKALTESGNHSERKLSRFIVDRNFDISKLSAAKLGDMANVSDASVIRFSKNLGFSGFTELKMTLFSLPPQEVVTTGLYQNLTITDSTQSLIDKSKQLFTSRIDSSLSLMDASTIEQCAQELISANRVVVVGVGASALVAADINHKLIRSGINVHFNPDYHTQLTQVSLSSERDLVIFVSARGHTKEVLTALESAKEVGAKTVALTRFGKDKLAQNCDYVIPYYYHEEHAELGMVTPQILQMISFDVLFFKMTALIGHGNKPLAKAINTIIKTQS